jgi:rare lipoprotein A (peptidoglycan hydrolase)
MRHAARGDATRSSSPLEDVVLPSHLVAYHAPTTTTLPPPPAPVPSTTTTVVAPHVEVTPTTEAAPVTSGRREVGIATWYPQAGPGTCASHTLPRGLELTVTNNATGATIHCLIDDYEASPYPRVVDLSYSGFSGLADPSQGVVDVTISW